MSRALPPHPTPTRLVKNTVGHQHTEVRLSRVRVCASLGYGRISHEYRAEALDRLAPRASQMRHLDLITNRLGDEWVVEFARRALPHMPELEYLG